MPLRSVTSFRLERHKLSPAVEVEVSPSRPTVPVTDNVLQGELVPIPILPPFVILRTSLVPSTVEELIRNELSLAAYPTDQAKGSVPNCILASSTTSVPTLKLPEKVEVAVVDVAVITPAVKFPIDEVAMTAPPYSTRLVVVELANRPPQVLAVKGNVPAPVASSPSQSAALPVNVAQVIQSVAEPVLLNTSPLSPLLPLLS